VDPGGTSTRMDNLLAMAYRGLGHFKQFQAHLLKQGPDFLPCSQEAAAFA